MLPLTVTLGSVPLPPAEPSSETKENQKSFEPSIKLALDLLLPAVVHLPLSIPFLNNSQLSPISKDEDLHSGVLQLPEDTMIIVSDSEVSEGTVTERRLTHSFEREFSLRNVQGVFGILRP